MSVRPCGAIGLGVWSASLLLLAAFSPARAAGQEQEPVRVWAALGAGGGAHTRESTSAIALMAQIAAQRGPQQLMLRAAGIADLFGSSNFSELGLLYGRAASSGFVHASLNAGIAATSGSGPGYEADGGRETEYGVGVPVVAQLAIRPLPVLGLGLELFGTVSTIGSMGGILAVIQVGWMP